MQIIKYLIQKFLIANFDPEAEKFVFAPSEPSSTNSFEVLSNVVTVYHGSKASDSSTLQALFNQGLFQCDGAGRKTLAPFQFGHHNNPWHSAWHRNQESFEDTHHHIFKQDFANLAPNDLRCILQQIHLYQKENKLCETGDDACVLSENDAAKLLGRYKKHHQEVIQAASDSLYTQFEQAYIQGIQAFLNAFAVTFIQHLVKPLLLDQGMDNQRVQLISSTLIAGINFVSNRSAMQSLAAIAAASISEKIFTSAGLPAGSARTVAGILNTVLATVSKPLNIADWLACSLGALTGTGLAYKSASMGGKLAHHVIQTHFSKLRIEPRADNSADDHARVVQQANPTGGGGLRRR